jgi:hypothetical protein
MLCAPQRILRPHAQRVQNLVSQGRPDKARLMPPINPIRPNRDPPRHRQAVSLQGPARGRVRPGKWAVMVRLQRKGLPSKAIQLLATASKRLKGTGKRHTASLATVKLPVNRVMVNRRGIRCNLHIIRDTMFKVTALRVTVLATFTPCLIRRSMVRSKVTRLLPLAVLVRGTLVKILTEQ